MCNEFTHDGYEYGYGWYWKIVEMMRENSNWMLEDKNYIWDAIAVELRTTTENARNFIEACIDKYELFYQQNGYIFSESLLRRKKKSKA